MREIWTFWKLMNAPCEDIARLISTSLDRDLSRRERFVVRSHLLYCVACRRFRAQIRFLKDAVARLRDQVDHETEQSSGLPPETRARILRALKDHP